MESIPATEWSIMLEGQRLDGWSRRGFFGVKACALKETDVWI